MYKAYKPVKTFLKSIYDERVADVKAENWAEKFSRASHENLRWKPSPAPYPRQIDGDGQTVGL